MIPAPAVAVRSIRSAAAVNKNRRAFPWGKALMIYQLLLRRDWKQS